MTDPCNPHQSDLLEYKIINPSDLNPSQNKFTDGEIDFKPYFKVITKIMNWGDGKVIAEL